MNSSRMVAGFTAVVAALGVVATATPASASQTSLVISGTSTVQYHCVEPPYPDADTTLDVTFTAPAVAHKGTNFTVTAKVKATAGIPIDVPANGTTASVGVVLSGSQSGTVTATGLTNTAVVPAGQLLTLTGGAATVSPTRVGVLLFTPGGFESTNWLGQHLVCTPITPPSVASLSIVVS
ncbi:hypothetical protein [Micromonospora wenchangensis]|uniref:hypothetical protein n=1 Tax=Micromonospora wenchangensis TaxID=1185415 RepID=UPI003D75C209